jgi:biotin carboxyl carrier protein
MGNPRTCAVKDLEGTEGSFDVLSPSVGLYDRPPAVGSFVKPGSFAGYLTLLRRYFHLLIPEGHHGVVTELYVSNRKQSVEYGQILFRVSLETHTALGTDLDMAEPRTGFTEEDIPKGMFGVKSPTDGIFYTKPNPQSPPYVEVDSLVSTGSILGLVEVMKCFNQIIYPGQPEFPPQARIVRIIHEDTSEVKHGSLLFVIAPVG